MAKNGSNLTQERDSSIEETDDASRTLLDRGRSMADHLPDVVDDARAALDAAQGQLDLLSDRGVIAAVGFTTGIAAGLFLAGAPRFILAVSMIPVAITTRSALTRGVRLSRLVN